MGHQLLALAPRFENIELVGVIAIPQAEDIQAVDCYGSLDELETGVDLVVDFTLPGGPRAVADWCGRNGAALVSGTTGLTEEDKLALKQAALKVPVLWAPNLSHGVALVNSLVRQAATALGVDADIHIKETHHVHKIDAPSGTALALAATAVEARGGSREDNLTFSSVREGEVIGEHTVSFSVADELVEIGHKALNRNIFASGALKAGEWLVGQAPGYYSTSDWLGLG